MPIPYPYQELCTDWLAARLVAMAALDMGLGKTGISIRAADAIGAVKILVVCPAVARTNWVREFALWQQQPRSVGAIYDSRDRPRTDVVIVNYDKFSRGSADDLLKQRWDVVILDEAHALKSSTAKRVKQIYGFLYGPADRSRQGGLVTRAGRVWLLTATPVPNHAGELWTHLRALTPERLPTNSGGRPLTYNQFVERYCDVRDTNFGIQILGNKKARLPELKQLLDGFMLRLKKTEVLQELPPLRFTSLVLEPAEDSADLRRLETHPEIRELVTVLEAACAKRELDERASRRLTRDEVETLLEKLANRPGHIATLRRLTGMLKVAPALELLHDELADGALDKVVIFAVHRETIERLTVGLKEFGAVSLHGGTSTQDRQAAIDGFQSDPKIRVLVGQIQACGTAINLTAADNVVFAEASWVPADNAQAAARCHRIGTTRPVLARFLALAGSVDELVADALARKARTASQILDEEKA